MIAFLPQAYQVWKTKSVEDVSLLTYTILMFGSTSWTTYGLLKDDWPIIITNVTLFVVQGSIIVCKLKYGKKTSH
jgi:MtN3 and saliva related transmembrane protein